MSWLMLAGLALFISGCGDSPQAVPTTGSPSDTSGYTGPYAKSDDILSFQSQFWEPLHADDRCGSCHGVAQSPMFVLKTDVNVAYNFAKDYVDVTNPADSVIVGKVGQGHHCWLGSSSANVKACTDIITRYINNWLGAGSGGGRAIVLTAPVLVDPGDSKHFPATAQEGNPSFENSVYRYLNNASFNNNCHGCHSSTAATPQAPFFADDNVNVAYEAAKAKMNLNEGSDSSDKSRFVLRLRNEFHNCWTSGSSGCDSDATEMRDAIIAFANGITATSIDTSLITSKAMTFGNAIVASGGSRAESNQIALWEFKEGSGSIAYDTSGIEPAINLALSGDDGIGATPNPTYQWVNGYGIEFLPCAPTDQMPDITCAKAQSSSPATKLHDYIQQSGQYAIEAWVVPANVTQERKSIISYSEGGAARNFTMAQTMYNYEFINHTNITDGTQNSQLSTDPDDEDLQATLQHVVMNFDPVNGRQIYVNGVSTGDSDVAAEKGGTVLWSNSFSLLFGNEQGGTEATTSWKGKLRFVAIHNRVLSAADIRQNFAAGVGQKYLMLFSITNVAAGIPADSYIMFEVEQYDNYAYSFTSPKFINLNSGWSPTAAIPIKGIRIAINGKEAVAGQAFASMDTTVTAGEYSPTDGQLLSNLGTIIASENGFDSDEFFLTFEQLGSATHAYSEADPVTPTAPADPDMVSQIGVRSFDEINATMSAVTGVPVTNAAVKSTFDQYRRQLPAVEDVQAYLSSHQMAVAQLAMKYCDVLVETNPAYFSPFSFTQVPSVAFANATGRNNVLNPMLIAIMNVDVSTPSKNLGSQPDETEIRDMLASDSPQTLDASASSQTYDSLIDCMTRCERGLNECDVYVVGTGDTNACSVSETNNTTTRTKQVVKATCAAMLGSAVMLVQ